MTDFSGTRNFIKFIQTNMPDVSVSTKGDLWYNPNTNFYYFNGIKWILQKQIIPLEPLNIDFSVPDDYVQEDNTITRINGKAELISTDGDVEEEQFAGAPYNLVHGKAFDITDDGYLCGVGYATSLSNHPGLAIYEIANSSNKYTLAHEYFMGSVDLKVDGDYIYISSSGRILSINISDKTNLGIDNENTTDRLYGVGRIAISGNYIYTKSVYGFIVIDKTTLDIIVEVDHVDFTNSAESDIIIIGDYVYLSDLNWLFIIDISNRISPIIKGHVSDNRMNGLYLTISDNFIYATGKNTQSMCVVDISNKDDPIVVGGITDPRLYQVLGISIIDHYAYVVAGMELGRMLIIDISDNNNLRFTDQCDMLHENWTEYNTFRKIMIHDGYVYFNKWHIISRILLSTDLSRFKRELIFTPTTPRYITTTPNTQFDLIGYVTITECNIIYNMPADTDIKCLVSFDNKTSWMKYNTTSSAWAIQSGGLSNLQSGNTITELITGLTNCDVSTYLTLDFAFDLNTSVTTAGPSIDNIEIKLT